MSNTNNKTTIMLVNGKKRSGKDFFAEKLQEELYKNGKTSAIISFADPIKDIISITFGIKKEDLEVYKNSPSDYHIDLRNNLVFYSTDFRKILQRFGTEAMKKHFGEDVWVDKLLENAKKENVDYIIVPDFRFLSEDFNNDEFKKITLNIFNNDIKDNDAHRSETELDEFNFQYYIDNTGHKDLIPQIQDFMIFLLHTHTC